MPIRDLAEWNAISKMLDYLNIRNKNGHWRSPHRLPVLKNIPQKGIIISFFIYNTQVNKGFGLIE